MNVLEELATQVGPRPTFKQLYDELVRRQPFPRSKTEVPDLTTWLLFGAAAGKKGVNLEELLKLAQQAHPVLEGLVLDVIDASIDEGVDVARRVRNRHLHKA